MNERQVNFFDHLLEEQKARARAVEQLQRIAKEYPDLFAEVAKCFLQPENGMVDVSDVTSGQEQTDNKLPATEAVLNWLDQHAEGTPGEIASALVDKISTRSARPAAIIYSTLGSLKKRGVVKMIRNKAGNKAYVKA